MAAARSVALLAASAALAVGCTAARPAPPPAPAGAATVVRVVDGDTLVARVGGAERAVRLIGIDTPESKKPGAAVECYAHEAAARLAELAPPGAAVTLVRDAEAQDRYGRLLAYVIRAAGPEDRGGLFVNLTLAAEGFADVLEVAPNTTFSAAFASAAGAARAGRLGLWGACGGGHEPAPAQA
ncbi:MAG: thermonuclease family protein [Acidimicrobiales bacterium]